MKIILVTPYFYPKAGGLENYAYAIAKGLQKRNCEVLIITSNHLKRSYTYEKRDGLVIYRLPISFVISNTPINFKWIYDIFKIIKNEKPDIINVHTPVPFISDITTIISKVIKIPVIITYHAAGFEKDQLFADIITSIYSNTLEKLILHLSNAIIVTNRFTEETYLHSYKEKIKTIFPGVDTTVFYPSKKHMASKNIVFVGNLSKAHSFKGLIYLLQAFSIVNLQYPESKLLIVGEGNMLSFYKEESKKYTNSKNIVFLGKKNQKDIADILKNSLLLALPSYSNAESFGMVLIEAMACKIPVIGSKIGGVPYVIQNNINGLLVSPKNVTELASAINFLIENPAKAKELAINGYKNTIDTYMWNNSIDQTYNLLTKHSKK